MPAKINIEFCTSCGSTEIEVTGNKYYCRQCDITYKVTEAGTKVITTNPLGKTNERLEQVEKDVEELKSKNKKPAESEPPAEPGPGADDDVNYHGDKNEPEEEEEDGFIIW